MFTACEELARRNAELCGGDVGDGIWHIRDTAWQPGQYVKWWNPPQATSSRFTQSEMRRIRTVSLDWALPRFLPGWKIENCRWSSGFRWRDRGRPNAVVLEPADRDNPAVMETTVSVPRTGHPRFTFSAGGQEPWRLRVAIDGRNVAVHEVGTDTGNYWTPVTDDLTSWLGGEVTLRLLADAPSASAKEPPPEMCLAGLAEPLQN